MKITTKEIPTAIPIEVTVEFSDEDANSIMDAAWEEIKPTLEIKGFRKGKVPRKEAEQVLSGGINMYGGYLVSELDQRIAENVHDEHGIIIFQFSRNLSPGKDGTNWKYRTGLHFQPAVTIDEEFKSKLKDGLVEIFTPAVNVDELVRVSVEKRYRDLQDDHQKLVPKEGPIEDGDVVILDCTTIFGNSKKRFDPGCFKRHKVLVGPNALRPPEIYEAIHNAVKDMPTVVNYNMSAEQGGPENKDKRMIATLVVREIMKAETPEIDDDLAISAHFPSKLAMDESIKATARIKAEAHKQAEVNKAIVHKIAEHCEIGPIPSVYLNNQIEESWAGAIEKIGKDKALQFLGAKDEVQAKQNLSHTIAGELCRELCVRAVGVQILGMRPNDVSFEFLNSYNEQVLDALVDRMEIKEIAIKDSISGGNNGSSKQDRSDADGSNDGEEYSEGVEGSTQSHEAEANG